MRGSKAEVLESLRSFFSDPLFIGDGEHLGKVAVAMGDIRSGGWLANVNGFVFEVVDPAWTVEQDVYGCPEGRGCTDVPAELRPGLEAMVRARLAAGVGGDVRRFHWFYRLGRRGALGEDLSTRVLRTVGSPEIADAAVILVSGVAELSAFDRVDVHATLLPDRIRLRIDDDYGFGRTGEPAVVFAAFGLERHDVVWDLVTNRAQRWGVVGDKQACSLWVDFPRTAGDAALLARNHRSVQADQITPGTFVYRDGRHRAWVEVAEVELWRSGVRVHLVDGLEAVRFASQDQVPAFADAPFETAGGSPKV